MTQMTTQHTVRRSLVTRIEQSSAVKSKLAVNSTSESSSCSDVSYRSLIILPLLLIPRFSSLLFFTCIPDRRAVEIGVLSPNLWFLCRLHSASRPVREAQRAMTPTPTAMSRQCPNESNLLRPTIAQNPPVDMKHPFIQSPITTSRLSSSPTNRIASRGKK